MKSVRNLRRKNNEVIIIGSGHSVKGFKFPKDTDRMGINFCPIPNLQYLVCDKKVPEKICKTDAAIIGFKQDDVDYYFDDHIDLGNHTGYRALQVATYILGYKTVYLIGFDYYDVDGVVHYFGDKFHENWIQWDGFYMDRKRYFDVFVSDFDEKKWTGFKIINLNPDSKLRRFK